MKKFYLLIFFICVSFINAQTKYEPGYYITNSGEKIECLIKNEDWKNNPSKINIRVENKNEVIEQNFIKEFFIEPNLKYVNTIIDLDEYNSNNITSLKKQKNSEFVQKKALLKVLSEGKATLYKYQNSGVERFFYSTEENNKITPLIYRKYLATSEDVEEYEKSNIKISEGITIMYNNEYKKQLFADVYSSDLKRSDIENLKYRESYLLKYFKKYNNEKDSLGYNYKKGKLKFKLVLGYNFSNAELNYNNNSYYSTNLNLSGLSAGVEFEYILPFNNNKFSTFIEPSFVFPVEETKHLSQNNGYVTYEQNLTVKHQYLQIPLGMRYYSYINEKNKLHFDLSIVPKIASKSSVIEYEKEGLIEVSSTTFSAGIGIGYQFQNFDIQARYYTKSKFADEFRDSYSSSFSNISLSLKYNFLK